jgi:DNA-binding CsgD family transcriptional regulator
VVALIDEMLETLNDRQIADQLNADGHHNWRGESFTMKKVGLVRRTYLLKSRFEQLRERGMLTGEEIAVQLNVSPTTVHHLGQQGVLKRHLYANNHRCLYEPPGDVLYIKGSGGRYGGTPARLMPAQPSQ